MFVEFEYLQGLKKNLAGEEYNELPPALAGGIKWSRFVGFSQITISAKAFRDFI
jgi:hypothetical protein